MGEAVYKDSFTAQEYQQFSGRLESQLEQLRGLLEQDVFNADQPSIGAELEMYAVDDDYQPAPVSEELLALFDHPQLTPELNRYNLEFNLSPVAAVGQPFAAMGRELHWMLDKLQAHLPEGTGHSIACTPIACTQRNEMLSYAHT